MRHVLALPIILSLTLAAAQPALAKSRDESHQEFLSTVKGLDSKVAKLALDAATVSWGRGIGNRNLLGIIDYSLPSTTRRFWVVDLANKRVLFHELVAHGKNTGENMATSFSNKEGSLQSSIGLFKTSSTYVGKHGYSLKLVGLEKGINDNAEARAIVIHGAWYVSDDFAKKYGRLGRSWGCPAVSTTVAKPLIDKIKDGVLIFVYYPDD